MLPDQRQNNSALKFQSLSFKKIQSLRMDSTIEGSSFITLFTLIIDWNDRSLNPYLKY